MTPLLAAFCRASPACFIRGFLRLSNRFRNILVRCDTALVAALRTLSDVNVRNLLVGEEYGYERRDDDKYSLVDSR